MGVEACAVVRSARRRYDRRMGYKLLGFIVWQGGKWYVRRRYTGVAAKAGLAGVGVALATGVVLAGRQARKGQQG
jgi:hypothetical protein